MKIAVTGATGQVGGVVAAQLLSAGRSVRVVVRDAAKAAPWVAKGCEVAIAEMVDAVALTSAFGDCDGVFILLPPVFDPSPDFREAHAFVGAVRDALGAARPGRVVCMSTIGAQADQPTLLRQLWLMEQELGALDLPVAFIRAPWFMENTKWEIEAARATGVLQSYLLPLHRAIPMVATADIGALAAQLLQEKWSGRRVVELHGPETFSPSQVAETLGKALGQTVRAVAVPRDEWEARFLGEGMRNPAPRILMLDGLNEGWLDYEGGSAVETMRGTTQLDKVLQALVALQNAA